MSWRTVFVSLADKMYLKLDNIIILKEGEEYSIPLSDISLILLEGETEITTRLLNSIAKYNISLVVSDREHLPSGIFTNISGHSRASKTLKYQLNWSDDIKNLAWQKIIKGKIYNQLTLLKFSDKENLNNEIIKGYIEEVLPGDITNREGHSAKIFFNNFFGKNFTREQEGMDIINSSLNYGYSIVRAYIARLCIGYGLVTMLGIHHKSEYNRHNLVDDLIEPFRSFVDLYVYKYIIKDKFFKREHRLLLADILNKKVFYDNKNSLLTTAMEKYIFNFKNALNSKSLKLWEIPEVRKFEEIGYEV